MIGEEKASAGTDDDRIVQATIDSLIHQRERAQNEAAEYMARGQVQAMNLKAAEEEIVALREELMKVKGEGKSKSENKPEG